MKGRSRMIIASLLLIVLVFGYFFFRQSNALSEDREPEVASSGISIDSSEPYVFLLDESVYVSGDVSSDAIPPVAILHQDGSKIAQPAPDPAPQMPNEPSKQDARNSKPSPIEEPKCDPEPKPAPDDNNGHATPSEDQIQPNPATEDGKKDPPAVADQAPSVNEEYVVDASVKDPEDSLVHSHSFKLVSTKDPTCTKDGEKVYLCSCGESYSERVAAFGHSFETVSSREVIDQEPYCQFQYLVIWCTSPSCCEDGSAGGKMLTSFSSKDHGYSYEKTRALYNEHAAKHLANGEQASYTAEPMRGSEPASMYEKLFTEQSRTPHAVMELKLIPEKTHTETICRCIICGLEK